ncbi:MAG: hypothetical protein A2Y62_19925 [Candidatus Fischerbacteria bacterium RBG_13_37_8]|uniref:SLH domain-containing protein n=1 Tax=Candidatus Fischerbacteria bacterium RBG_13_37_8 TaxID=1817863 RepID=A0A1F5VNU7_9BACT|nr:MAG: hypothetical protein A2Y62_19925 [Candidatus Fischerbacteria bacterium RBG_13_37_8]
MNDTTVIATDANGTSTLICNNTIALISQKPAIDDSAGSTPNGIIEPDEIVDLIGNVENIGTDSAISVTGLLTTFDPITINNANVTYPDIAPGGSENSLTNYSIMAPSANRPSTHWDVKIAESPGCPACNSWLYNFAYHVGNSFFDVPPAYLLYSFIETLLHSEVTAGCTTTDYCPEMNVTRQQMAKFICLAMEATEPGSCPTAPCTEIFADVPAGNIFCSYIEGVYNAGVVSGCQSLPLMYCPSVNVTRAQMAKFIINAFGFPLY